MPEPSPAYLWYPKDALSSGRIAALSPLEELWYRRALDQSWLHDGLPSDPAEFAGWVGRGCTVEAAQKLIEKFFRLKKKDGLKVVQERQEKERKILQQKRQQKSNAGKQGMANRWKQKSKGGNSVITEYNIPIPIPTSIKEEEKRVTAKPSDQTKSDPVERRIWKDGVDLLKTSGLTENQARPILGKMAQGYGKPLLAECIAVAQAQNPADPKTFLFGVLRERSGINGRVKSAVGKERTDIVFVPDPPCDVCGKEICLSLHREERSI